MTLDTIVIGLGAHGSAALYHLARTGKRALGIEAFAPAHEGGSSHGESRIIRLAYFEHPAYVPLVRRAFEGWRALEHESRRRILSVTGIIEAGWPGSEIVAGSLRASREHGLVHEELGASEINARFPALTLPAGWSGVFQPEAGILRPELGIATHLDAARALGAETRIGTAVAAVEPAGQGVCVTLADGTRLEAASAILSAGAWTPDLTADLNLPLTLTRQVIAWYAPAEPALTTPEALPVFLVESPEEAVYGFPDFAGSGVKAGSHLPGRILASAADARQDAGEADFAPVRDLMRQCLPAAAGPVRAARTCIYTSTPDSDFIIDRHPIHPQIVIASACSGHGYKFAPVIGEALARMASGGEAGVGFERFGIGRFG